MPSCAFCPSEAKLSGEHIWSEWVGDLFGTGKNRFTFRRFAENRGTTRGPVVKEWKKHEIDFTANVVCVPCNTRWMSSIESTQAKPTLERMIVSGSPVSILPRGVTSIALFAFLKAVVADHMHATRRPFFTRRQRYEFRENRTIPDGIQMWLGRFRSPGHRGNVTTYYFKIDRGSFAGYEFYVFTYVINYVALQLTAPRWPSLITEPLITRPPRLVQHDAWSEGATEFWPDPALGVLWPPPKTLNRQSLHDFAFRWTQLNVPP